MARTIETLRVDGIPVKVDSCHCGRIPSDPEIEQAVREELKRVRPVVCAVCGKPFIYVEALLFHQMNGKSWVVSLREDPRTWEFPFQGGMRGIKCHMSCICCAFPHLDEDNKQALERRLADR